MLCKHLYKRIMFPFLEDYYRNIYVHLSCSVVLLDIKSCINICVYMKVVRQTICSCSIQVHIFLLRKTCFNILRCKVSEVLNFVVSLCIRTVQILAITIVSILVLVRFLCLLCMLSLDKCIPHLSVSIRIYLM